MTEPTDANLDDMWSECDMGPEQEVHRRFARAVLAKWGQPAHSGEPVYAFRRKGLDDFCTCTEKRYAELSDKPTLFETRIFYTAPQPLTAQPAPATQPAPQQEAPADDLRTRCEEILAWRKTGVLPGEALRTLAREKYGDEYDAIQRAERDTETEALNFVVAAPTTQPTPQQEAQEPVYAGSGQPITQEDIVEARERIQTCQASALLSGSDREARRAFDDRHKLYSILGDANCHLHGEISAPQPSPASQGDALDAARLDWLIEQDNCVVFEGVNGFCLCWIDEHDPQQSEYQTGTFPTARAAIDAARAAQEGK